MIYMAVRRQGRILASPFGCHLDQVMTLTMLSLSSKKLVHLPGQQSVLIGQGTCMLQLSSTYMLIQHLG